MPLVWFKGKSFFNLSGNLNHHKKANRGLSLKNLPMKNFSSKIISCSFCLTFIPFLLSMGKIRG